MGATEAGSQGEFRLVVSFEPVQADARLGPGWGLTELVGGLEKAGDTLMRIRGTMVQACIDSTMRYTVPKLNKLKS